VTDVGEGEGRIEGVLPRERVLARRARNTRDVEQIVLANPDQALFVFALTNPEPHLRLLDRFLILAEAQHLPAVIGVNKIDLAGDVETGRQQALATFADYLPHYQVLPLCAKSGAGLDELRSRLHGKVTVIAGPSGVGKTSLLNRLNVSLEERVGAISDATGKGRHTTTSTRLFPLDERTFVADTPGIRALILHGVEPEELDACFPEFRPFLGGCRYADCAHLHEPGCAVREALAEGRISPHRYDSYARLRRSEPEE
jgi:ribosome biogenesis GTPase